MTQEGSLEEALRLDPDRWKEFKTFERGWSVPKRKPWFEQRLGSCGQHHEVRLPRSQGTDRAARPALAMAFLSCSWSTLASSASAHPLRSSRSSWILVLPTCGYRPSTAPAQPAVSVPSCPTLHHPSYPSTPEGHLPEEVTSCLSLQLTTRSSILCDLPLSWSRADL